VESEHYIKTIERIEAFIVPFDPPVQAFEKSSSRTLISVLLSSRTKDAVTKKSSEALFDRAETPETMLELGEDEVARLIYPVGFYRQKAKNIVKICETLADSDRVPDSFEELTALPGVGRKTANLVLAIAFKQPAIAVDIHVFRISRRLGWAKGGKPELVEEELKLLFPPGFWRRINQALVGFGQTVCKPQKPKCDICVLNKECPFFLNQKN